VSDHIVASEFKVTGLGSANFDDNFIADAGTLNSNIWKVNASVPACVDLIGPAVPYLVQWTTPAIGYSLQSTPSLSANSWTPTISLPSVTTGTLFSQFISTNDLPAGKSDYFSVVQRTFSQLLVLLPGETNAPNTATGKVGTPAPFSLSASGNILTFNVLAVDPKFYPVAGITDSLTLSDTDGGIYSNPFKLVNGAVQIETYYQNTATNVVITATDTTTTTIKPGLSTAFTVGP
jgi:hypothetical protein